MKRLFFVLLALAFSTEIIAQQWEVSIDTDGIRTKLVDACCNHSNETVLVGFYDSVAYAAKFDENGNYQTKLFSAEGITSEFYSIILLDNGNYLVTGKSRSSENDYLWVVILNNELEKVTERFFEKEEGYEDREFGWCRSMQDIDGTIVLAAGLGVVNYGTVVSEKPLFLRLNEEYECIDRVFISEEDYNYLFYSTYFEPAKVMNVPNSTDIIMVCHGEGNCVSMLRFDYDFNLVSHKVIRDKITDQIMGLYYCSDYCLGNDTILMVTDMQDPEVYDEPFIILGKVDKNGTVYDRVSVNKTDTLNYAVRYNSMCTANDTTIYMISKGVIGSFIGPVALEVYLCTKNLEILGCKSYYNEIDYFPSTAIATNDMGLVTASIKPKVAIHIKKHLREDFNPIPCSITEIPISGLEASLFPNPTNGLLNVDMTNINIDSGNVRYQILDASGRTLTNRIIHGSGNLLTLDVSALESGTYIVQIISDDKVIANKKFQKIK